MIKSIKRLAQLFYILTKYRIDQHFFLFPILAPFRLFYWLNPKNWRQVKLSRAIALRLCLEELGPIFIKLGQAIAIRRDLISNEYADELALLQDKVAPFEGARDQLETYYGFSLEHYFKSFEELPLAAASIAQVHEAILHSGESVVVKIVRPDIAKKIKIDLRMMRLFARGLLVFIPSIKRLRPYQVIDELERTLTDELDLIREGANASQLKRDFKHDKRLYVPKIYWNYSQKNVLVIEKIQGIPIYQIDAMKAAGIDLKVLAALGVELFFKQVFNHNFFHADMHPGNLFVKVNSNGSPQLIVVDFGIMGSLSHFDKRYLAQNFYAFIQKDYYRVAELHIESHWVPRETRIDELTAAVRAICEPILERPIQDISCAQLLLRLFNVGRQFNMEILPQLLLLQKTLFAVEGLGRTLDPELNIWATAKPSIEAWVKKELGVRQLMSRLKKHLPQLLEALPTLGESNLRKPITNHAFHSLCTAYLAGSIFTLISIIVVKAII